MTTPRRRGRGPEILRHTFGGTLYQQGRGFYASLELLAMIRGEILLERTEAVQGADAPERTLPRTGEVAYLRRSHDHARRVLASDETVIGGVFADERTRRAVRSLLEGLEAPVPGRRRTNESWQKRHLYPYPPEAIHYDAVAGRGRGRISIETYAYRGGGALAHKMLRTDPEVERLDETRCRLRKLLGDGGGAVGRLLDALAGHDEFIVKNAPIEAPDGIPSEWFEDAIERQSFVATPDDPEGPASRETRWTELLREGVARVLDRRKTLSDFERVDALVRWVPWCLARHQLAMARRALGRDENAPLVFDTGHGRSAVRARARTEFNAALGAIKDGLLARAVEFDAPELLSGNGKWWKDSRTFYPTTLFAVGALNANTGGSRCHELKPELLQTIVHALVDEPIEFERFGREILGERLGIVCDGHAGVDPDSLGLDRRDLRENGLALIARLEETGLARAYSDSTLMVGVHE